MPTTIDEWLKPYVDRVQSSKSKLFQKYPWLEPHVRRIQMQNPNSKVLQWLEPYLQLVQNPKNETRLPNFMCFNPINHQSEFVGFTQYTTKQDLKERYDVIGDQSQMDKTVCMIFLRYTGHLAPQCDCSPSRQRRLVTKMDHGVLHHGDTFNITASQKAAIDAVTQDDALLYKMATELFEEQVREVEEELGVVLCEKIKPEIIRNTHDILVVD